MVLGHGLKEAMFPGMELLVVVHVVLVLTLIKQLMQNVLSVLQVCIISFCHTRTHTHIHIHNQASLYYSSKLSLTSRLFISHADIHTDIHTDIVFSLIGTFNNNNDNNVSPNVCTNCQAGKYSACTNCPIGSSGGTTCTSCTPGKYSLMKSTTCSLCNIGYWNKEEGSISANDCEVS